MRLEPALVIVSGLHRSPNAAAKNLCVRPVILSTAKSLVGRSSKCLKRRFRLCGNFQAPTFVSITAP